MPLKSKRYIGLKRIQHASFPINKRIELNFNQVIYMHNYHFGTGGNKTRQKIGICCVFFSSFSDYIIKIKKKSQRKTC